MTRPRICGVLVDHDLDAARAVAAAVDLFEVRIDLIGDGWPEVARALGKPWVACNRRPEEGGRWQGTEAGRLAELIRAVELGAALVDVELMTPDLTVVLRTIGRRAERVLSYHDLVVTPSLDSLREVVAKQLAAGADVCKVVTTARRLEDNLDVLQLVREFPGRRVVSFAMGEAGHTSRVLCPLVGGAFTYASVAAGRESAPGQIAAAYLRRLYDMMIV